ncbi:MAG: biopolymer transport protein ExbB, partial [Bradyrhizobium sp.]|nr:biopolymer transport protein ExbB [Bradyrhizobium sp.]
MNVTRFGATCGVIPVLAMLSLASPSLAQQKTAPAPAAQTPAVSQPTVQAPAAPVVQAPAPAIAQPAPASPGPETAASVTNSGSRSLKAEAASLRELSPWSMFLSADILVKAVMIGLAFASLLTWTIFIAKMI